MYRHRHRHTTGTADRLACPSLAWVWLRLGLGLGLGASEIRKFKVRTTDPSVCTVHGWLLNLDAQRTPSLPLRQGRAWAGAVLGRLLVGVSEMRWRTRRGEGKGQDKERSTTQTKRSEALFLFATCRSPFPVVDGQMGVGRRRSALSRWGASVAGGGGGGGSAECWDTFMRCASAPMCLLTVTPSPSPRFAFCLDLSLPLAARVRSELIENRPHPCKFQFGGDQERESERAL